MCKKFFHKSRCGLLARLYNTFIVVMDVWQLWYVTQMHFVLQHAVFFATQLVGYLIPDVPARVRQLQLRELYLAKEARYEAAFIGIHEEKKDRKDDEHRERLRSKSMDIDDPGV